MKKSPTFTLVRKVATSSRTVAIDTHIVTRPGDIVPEKKYATSRSDAISPSVIALLDSAKKIPKSANTLDPKLKKALASSFVRTDVRGKQSAKARPSVNQSFLSVKRDLVRQRNVLHIGVLDMGAWIGGLPKLLEKLNGAQSMFKVFEVQAPVPAGLLKTPAGMAQWAAQQLGRPLRKSQREALMPHVIDDEFFAAGEDIRKDLGLDYLVGMTPAMVAGTEEDGSIYWNHFSSSGEEIILLSTADLRRFSELAGRPYEAAIGILLVAGLLVSINSDLDYHHKDTGCIFDFNADREGLVTTIHRMYVDSQCLEKMTEEQRVAVESMLSVLRRLKRRNK